MMITHEQARLAAEYLQTSNEYSCETHVTCDPPSPELLERVAESLRCVPDVRDDRIEHARCLIEGDLPSASDLAEKLIGRIISDAIR